MDRLKNFKEIADRNLGGLRADTRLLRQIQNAREPKPEIRIQWRPVFALSIIAVMLLSAGLIALPRLIRYDNDMHVVSRSAGGDMAVQTFQLTASVPAGSVNIAESAEQALGDYSLFAPGQNANFPLVKIGNATYRLLTEPQSLSADMLGEQLGTVTEFTSEPAIGTGSVISNTVQADQPVYAIRGMKGAAVAADVQGSLRVFQRVSFGGTAIVGREGLKDVLIGDASVVAIALSGVGRITKADLAQEVANVLLRYASYEGAAESASRSQSLLIKLDNGLTVQMNAGSGTVSACGTWSCPEFFDAFSDAVSD